MTETASPYADDVTRSGPDTKLSELILPDSAAIFSEHGILTVEQAANCCEMHNPSWCAMLDKLQAKAGSTGCIVHCVAKELERREPKDDADRKFEAAQSAELKQIKAEADKPKRGRKAHSANRESPPPAVNAAANAQPVSFVFGGGVESPADYSCIPGAGETLSDKWCDDMAEALRARSVALTELGLAEVRIRNLRECGNAAQSCG